MQNTFKLLLLALLLSACNSGNSNETKTQPEEPAVTVIPDTTSAETGTNALNLVQEREHIYSNPAQPDKFRLELQNGKATFTIKNAEGKLLYEENFTADDLEAALVYEMETSQPSLQERQDFIRKRVKEFFDEENFNSPAIAPNDIFDTSYGQEQAWNEIKKDKKSISFSYLLGKENGKRIAYSPSEKKVMLVGFFGG